MPGMNRPETPRSWIGAAAGACGCAAFVVFALVAEVVSSQYANSVTPAWAHGLVPLEWPQAARVGWWLAAAGAALGYQVQLRRLGIPQRRWVVACTVAPFVIFAGGIAAGADWATWH